MYVPNPNAPSNTLSIWRFAKGLTQVHCALRETCGSGPWNQRIEDVVLCVLVLHHLAYSRHPTAMTYVKPAQNAEKTLRCFHPSLEWGGFVTDKESRSLWKHIVAIFDVMLYAISRTPETLFQNTRMFVLSQAKKKARKASNVPNQLRNQPLREGSEFTIQTHLPKINQWQHIGHARYTMATQSTLPVWKHWTSLRSIQDAHYAHRRWVQTSLTMWAFMIRGKEIMHQFVYCLSCLLIRSFVSVLLQHENQCSMTSVWC